MIAAALGRFQLLVCAGYLAVALPSAANAGSDDPEPRPIVVELFTSQGCSSCPPADALLAELAKRPGMLALGFHISYWDRLGWKDPFSSEAATERQKTYARLFNDGQIYTPQIIVEGVSEMVGSDRAAVMDALRDARPAVDAPVRFAADRRSVMIGPGRGAGQIWLVRFAQHRTTRVTAGENARRVLDDANGVEALVPFGAWRGAAQSFSVEPPAPGHGLALLVQAPDGGMLGAAALSGGE